MTYLETLKLDAEKKIGPLAVHLAKLVKNLAGIRHRAAGEDEKALRLVEDVARLEAAAAEALGGSTNDCERFKTSIKKLTVRLATSREVVELFKKIIPPAQREIDETRKKLIDTFTALAVAARAGCEVEMSRLLDAVVNEHDGFMRVVAELGRDFGTGSRADPPVAYCDRLDSVHHRTSGGRWLVFKRAPVPATRSPAAVLACPASVESTPTVEKALGVEEARPLPPEGATEAPAAALGAAAERPGAAVACRPLVLLQFTGVELPPQDTPADPDLTLDGPDLDAADDQGEVDDAPDDGDLAEAPPADG